MIQPYYETKLNVGFQIYILAEKPFYRILTYRQKEELKWEMGVQPSATHRYLWDNTKP